MRSGLPRPGLVAALVGEARAIARGLLLLVIVCLCTWPLGGPFHTLHLLLHAVTTVAATGLAWTGAPVHP